MRQSANVKQAAPTKTKTLFSASAKVSATTHELAPAQLKERANLPFKSQMQKLTRKRTIDISLSPDQPQVEHEAPDSRVVSSKLAKYTSRAEMDLEALRYKDAIPGDKHNGDIEGKGSDSNVGEDTRDTTKKIF